MVCGGAGGIGQPMSLLLTNNPLVSEVAVFDIVGAPGVGADLSHCDAKAVARELDMYVDPLSGYPAFTAHYLRRRDCCGNRCRHCPWGHKNVGKTGRGVGAAAPNLEW